MQFRDLKKQYEEYQEEINAAVMESMRDAEFILGKKIFELEEQLAEYVGVKYCISCANGTDALQLALMTWGIGEGDAVFVPDFTFFSSGEIVSMVGATPVFVDIDQKTFNISTESLEKAIVYVKEHTYLNPKVIVAVDLFGQPADFNEVCRIAKQNNLYVLEDGAQGFGGKIGDRLACSFGDISTTSFFPAKPLGCFGDGGAIFTDNQEWYELLQSYRVHGKGEDKYDNIRVGMNSRLDTIQAAILQVKFKHFEEEIVTCKKAADLYTEFLDGYEMIETPIVLPGFRSSWAQYTILLKDANARSKAMQSLKDNMVPSMIYYKKPMHLQKAFAPLAVELPCPVTENVCDRCLSLPMGPFIDEHDIQFICDLLSRK